MSSDSAATLVNVVLAYRHAHKLQLALHELFSSYSGADDSWLRLAEEAEVFERKLQQVMRVMQKALDNGTVSSVTIPEFLRVE